MPSVMLNCPICQGVFQADTAWAGRQVTCPLCQGVVMIPGVTESVASDATISPKQTSQTEQTQTSPTEQSPEPSPRSPARPVDQPDRLTSTAPAENAPKPVAKKSLPDASAPLPAVFDPRLPLATEPLLLPAQDLSLSSESTHSSPRADLRSVSTDHSTEPVAIDLKEPDLRIVASTGQEVTIHRLSRSERTARRRWNNIFLAILAAAILAAALAILLNL